MAENTAKLAKRVAEIEARQQILDLKYRYFRAADGKDADGFRACFVAEGARISFSALGDFGDADALTKIYRDIALEKVDGQYNVLDMHHGFHPVITITGEGQAEGEWTLRYRKVDRRERTLQVSALEYRDTYVVEDGQWKIASTQATELWSVVTRLDDSAQVTSALEQL